MSFCTAFYANFMNIYTIDFWSVIEILSQFKKNISYLHDLLYKKSPCLILFYACVTFKILEKIISGYKNLISKRIPDSKYLAFNLKICTNMVFCHYQQLIVLLFWSAIVFDLIPPIAPENSTFHNLF